MKRFDQSRPIAETIEPFADLLIVRAEKEPEKTEGGILRPETARRKELFAEVVAVGRLANDALEAVRYGPETAERPEGSVARHVFVGDWVLISPYAGHAVDWGGEEYRFVRAVDLFGVGIEAS